MLLSRCPDVQLSQEWEALCNHLCFFKWSKWNQLEGMFLMQQQILSRGVEYSTQDDGFLVIRFTFKILVTRWLFFWQFWAFTKGCDINHSHGVFLQCIKKKSEKVHKLCSMK